MLSGDADRDGSVSTVVRGVDPRRARDVAELVQVSFGRALAGIAIPRDREAGVRLIASSLRLDDVYAAFDQQDTILGVAIVTGRGPVLRVRRRALVEAFGPWGGWWRYAIARLASRRRPQPGSLRGLEGFSVVPACRGRGIGSAMLDRILEDARSEGVRAIELNVGEANPARRLYERAGFTMTRTIPVGPFASRLGSRRMLFYELVL